MSSLKRPKVWIAFLAIVLFFLAYSPALDGPFVFDDQRQITDNPVVSHGVGLGETSFWTNINERPLTAFTLFLNHRISGADPFWFRITNMLLHILNAFMVFLIVKELFLLDGKKEKVDLAFGIGLLFLLHPLLSENFLYISQRGSTLSSFFYLGALFFYLRSKSTSIMRLLLSVLLFALALYSKQTAFSLIMVVALLELFVLPDSSNSRRAFVVTILTLGGLVLLYKYGGFTGKTFADVSGIDYLLLQISFMWKYLLLSIVPFPLILDYDLSTDLNLLWLSSGIVLLIGGLLWFIKTNSLVLRSGLVIYFFGNIVVLTIIPLPDVFVEHRMYIPFVGIALVLSHLFGNLKHVKYLWGVFLIFLLVFAFVRAQSWESKISLFEQNSKYVALNDRVWTNLGEAYLEVSNTAKALEATNKALTIDSSNYVALNNLGLIYLLEDNPEKAMEPLGQSLKYSMSNYRAWNNLGVAQMRLKKPRMALKSFMNSIKLNPRQFDAYYNIGLLAEQNRKPKEAIKAYLKCIKLQPSQWKAHHNLVLLMLAGGKAEEAKNFLLKHPFRRNYEYWNDLGAAHTNLSEPTYAADCFKKSLELEPSNGIALQNIERIITNSE